MEYAELVKEDETTENFLCPICLGVIQDPVENSCCGKISCQKCQDAHFASGKRFCVNCRNPNPTVTASKFLKRLIDQADVRCTCCKSEMKMEEFREHVTTVDISKLPPPAASAGGGAAASSSRRAPTVSPKNRDPCPELPRECPHAGRGCPFKGKLSELRNHVDNDCEKGFRGLDREALRICGGPERVARSVETIKRFLGLGGSVGVSGEMAAPLPPSRLQEQLETEEVHILARDFFALCGTDTGGGGEILCMGKSIVYGKILEPRTSWVRRDDMVMVCEYKFSSSRRAPVNCGASLYALFSSPSSFPVVSALCSSLLEEKPMFISSLPGKRTTSVKIGGLLASLLFHSALSKESMKMEKQRITARDELLKDYHALIRHRVVDTWNLGPPEDRDAPAAVEKRGVKRRRPNDRIFFETNEETWQSLFVEPLPEEKPAAPPSPPWKGYHGGGKGGPAPWGLGPSPASFMGMGGSSSSQPTKGPPSKGTGTRPVFAFGPVAQGDGKGSGLGKGGSASSSASSGHWLEGSIGWKGGSVKGSKGAGGVKGSKNATELRDFLEFQATCIEELFLNARGKGGNGGAKGGNGGVKGGNGWTKGGNGGVRGGDGGGKSGGGAGKGGSGGGKGGNGGGKGGGKGWGPPAGVWDDDDDWVWEWTSDWEVDDEWW